MYNIIDGNGHLFEEESSEFIEMILKQTKGGFINVDLIYNRFSNCFSKDEIDDFLNVLIDNGLLTVGKLSTENIVSIRQAANRNRISSETEPVKSIKEKLPFKQTNVETEYMNILENDNIPFSVMLELTYNCNEKCVHCYNPGAARNEKDQSKRHVFKELSIDDYRCLLDELKELGVVKIILSGGEPFIRKDIWEIIELIYERDFVLDIYTNGQYLINNCQKLSLYYPHSIGMSVYSDKDYIHDNITKIKGSFDKTLFVAQELSELGIPLYFKCPIMYHNSNTYFGVERLACKYSAIPQFDISLSNSLDSDTAVFDQLQIKGDLLEIILRDPNIPLYVGPEAPGWGQKEIDNLQPFCGAGINFVNITPEGFLNPCNSFPTQFGNVKEKSFAEIWQRSESLRKYKQTKIKDYYECGTHEKCYFCNRCPGASFIESGDFKKPSTNNCFLAIARMELSKKLQNNIDPLGNKNIQDILSENIIDQQILISKNVQNISYRNKEVL
ncbi:MAG: radical SAM protein [Ignavibacteria bacterium]|nr:radical SAM protein [Ignavibacteria bacterium]